MLLRLEKWLEDQVERFFGPRESVQPIEIARRMVRTMEEERRISVQHTYVPNSFVVYVAVDDLAELESFAHTLSQDMANHVKAAAQRQDFAFPGPVTVRFESDASLSRGQTRIIAQFVEEEKNAVDANSGAESDHAADADIDVPESTGRYRAQSSGYPRPEGGEVNLESTQFYRASRRPTSWRISVEEGPDAGSEFTVHLPATIGRRQGCDVQLHDPKVSRLHVRLEITPEGPALVDSDSTNGTRLNGRPVLQSQVAPGDIIELGATRLVIKTVGGE